MAQDPENIDVLIVGLGPVGATLACLLGKFGVSVLVVEKEVRQFPLPRAIALDHEALRILHLAGLKEGDFETIAIPNVRMTSPYFGEFLNINTSGFIDGHPKLVTFHQPSLEKKLRIEANKYDSTHILLGAEVTDLMQTEASVAVTVEAQDGIK